MPSIGQTLPHGVTLLSSLGTLGGIRSMGGAQAGTSSPQGLLTPGVSWPGMGQQSAPCES